MYENSLVGTNSFDPQGIKEQKVSCHILFYSWWIRCTPTIQTLVQHYDFNDRILWIASININNSFPQAILEQFHHISRMVLVYTIYK